MFKFKKNARKVTRKGIMFTIVSVLVCALIITSFFTFQSISLDSDVENTKLRIKGIDRFATETDAYVEGLTYVSGKTALDFTLDIMISNNSYLDNYTKEFESCLLTGNMTVPWNSVNQIICPEKSYLKGKFKSFENFSNNNLNLKSELTLNDVGVEQEDPWAIIIYVNYTIVIRDSYAFWNETRIAKSTIGLTGLRDPTYAIVNSNSELYSSREMNHTINLSRADVWEVAPSTAHSVVMNGSYFAWNGAPSYLERLEGIKYIDAEHIGNFSGTNGAFCIPGAGRCGIASVIPVSRMQTYSIDHGKIRSSVDFEFWKNLSLETPEERYFYGRYDFWKEYPFEVERTTYGITSSNAAYGLNGTVIPDTLMVVFNMTDPAYIDDLN